MKINEFVRKYWPLGLLLVLILSLILLKTGLPQPGKRYKMYFYSYDSEKYCRETDITILAYCLMENHVHLLIRDRNGAAPIFMKKMGVSYAQYYNRKYDRMGHLFQDRYKSERIEDDVYDQCDHSEMHPITAWR